jgi:hypothetical protein
MLTLEKSTARTMAIFRPLWPMLLTPVVLLCLIGPTSAAFVNNFRDWNLYVHDDQSGKVCYIASVPTKSDGNYTRRGAAAVLVAKLPSEPPNEQVSVQPGYPYLEGSEVELKIGDKSWQLFTQGEHAWAKTADDDKAIIASMKAGVDMSVKGTSQKKTWSQDSFSLLGFTAAYDAMLGACKG